MINDHSEIEDGVRDANTNKEPPKLITHHWINIVVKEEGEDAQYINRNFIDDMLMVDQGFSPLGLTERVCQHDQAAEHDNEHAQHSVLGHKNNCRGVCEASEKEHQRVHHGAVPLLIQF